MTCEAPRHGTATAYQAYGCRCPDGREAQRLYRKRRNADAYFGKARKVPSIGSKRRVQALRALGWPLATVLQATGYVYIDSLPWFLRDDVEVIHRATAQRIKDTYDSLSMTPGPSARCAANARARGWAVPLMWDDDEIDNPAARPRRGRASTPDYQIGVDEAKVIRAARGERLHLTAAERHEAIRHLHSQRLNDQAIAARLGVSDRQVQRDRAALGLAAVAA